MNAIFGSAGRVWNGFIENAARACEGVLARFASQRRATLVESAPGQFDVFAEGKRGRTSLGAIGIDARGALTSGGRQGIDAVRGGRVTLVLRPQRFLVRDFPLPAHADEFLDRILRNQIDRLTPWPGERAIFGHARREGSGSALVVAVAAGDRQAIQPVIDALEALKPRQLAVFAGANEQEKTPPIRLPGLDQGAVRHATLRKALGGLLLLLSLAVSGTMAWAAFEGMRIDSDYESTQAQIARLRGGARRADPVEEAESRLFQRKARGPVAALVIEELSRILPDGTWLTELEIAGDKARIGGLSGDATALIGIIEKSPNLSDAAFFAPTTRGTQDPGERFHIEATIRPRGDKKS